MTHSIRIGRIYDVSLWPYFSHHLRSITDAVGRNHFLVCGVGNPEVGRVLTTHLHRNIVCAKKKLVFVGNLCARFYFDNNGRRESMRNKKTLPCVFVCAFAFLTTSLAYGQATGSLSGTVSDKTGSVIATAKVVVTSQGTGVSRDSTTDGTGHYLVPLLPVAVYTIRVQASVFQAAEQKDVKLQVDEHREVNFTLAPASVTATVEVSATEVAVQTGNATLGQVITEQQVADLPLNGRNFVQLATLTPGTTQETNPASF